MPDRGVVPSPLRFRRQVEADDPIQVRELLTATSFFHPEEIAIGVELVEEALRGGSDYQFRFALCHGQTVGYACFGPIPLTRGSWDLYWIAVHPSRQNAGVGALLLAEVETSALDAGCQQMFVDTSGRPLYEPTRAFYERRGYHCAARLEDFYAPGDAKVVYCKRLSVRPTVP